MVFLAMSEEESQVDIGSEVFIDLNSVQENLPLEIQGIIHSEPIGQVIDYKMTDGGGIGVVVKLKNGSIAWFFANEVKGQKQQSLGGNSKELTTGLATQFQASKKDSFRLVDKAPTRARSIAALLNPINFLKWLKYSLKDVI